MALPRPKSCNARGLSIMAAKATTCAVTIVAIRRAVGVPATSISTSTVGAPELTASMICDAAEALTVCASCVVMRVTNRNSDIFAFSICRQWITWVRQAKIVDHTRLFKVSVPGGCELRGQLTQASDQASGIYQNRCKRDRIVASLLLALVTAVAPAGAQPAPTCNLANFLAVQHAHVNHAEVVLCGTVVRLRRPRRTRSGEHRTFMVDVGRGDRIEIDANLDVMGDFPISDGESTTIQGEYYYDQNGREGVHWTHHTDRGRHPPGYIILDGTRYD